SLICSLVIVRFSLFLMLRPSTSLLFPYTTLFRSPLLSAVIVAFFNSKINVARTLSKVLSVINLGVSVFVFWYVFSDGTIVLETGGWEAPFGIVLVADSLAVILVLTTIIVASACAFYAPHSLSENKEKHYLYT